MQIEVQTSCRYRLHGRTFHHRSIIVRMCIVVVIAHLAHMIEVLVVIGPFMVDLAGSFVEDASLSASANRGPMHD